MRGCCGCDAPSVVGLSPVAGPVSGGTAIIVTGVNFTQSETMFSQFSDKAHRAAAV